MAAFTVNVPILLGQVPDLQGDLKAAATAEGSGHYEEAAALYEKLLSGIDSSKVDPWVGVHVRTRLATVYYLLHRYRESVEAVAPLTSKNAPAVQLPAQAWLVQGLDQLELGQLSQAMDSLRRTLAVNPDSGTARLALGDALERSGRLEEAAEEYEEQTRRAPSVADAWYKLGLAYSRLAAQTFQEFTQKFPTSLVRQQLDAENRLAKGDDMGAAGILLRLLPHAPHQPQAHAELGTALINLGFPKSAEDQFRQELSYDPESPLARLGLAESEVLRGNWESAISGMEQLAGSQPRELARLLDWPAPGVVNQAWAEGKVPLPPRLAGAPGALVWQAWLSDADSRPTPAVVSHSCADPPARATSALGLWMPETCYHRLRERLKTKKPLTTEQRIKLAEAEFRLGNHQAARQEALSLLKSNPRSEWGLYWLSRSNSELAEDCFSKVASLNPESARVHQILGGYFSERHNFPHAKKEYQAALQLAPNLPDLHLGLAEAYWLDGQWPEAEKEFERTLELAPASAIAEYELGDALLKEHQWQPAMEHLRRALRDPSLAFKVRLDLSKAEAEMGQMRQALEELLPVAEADKDGELHYRLAGLYRKLGDKARAAEALATFQRLRSVSVQVDRADLEALEKEREKSESSNTPDSPR